jgi:Na+-translocating ferredoxin:NAD+ oxidoreductase RnfA subunit
MLLLALLRPFVPIETGVLCPLRAVTGVPCPFCGMTTSVTAAAHLDVAGAFAANPAGIVAVLVALYLLVRRPQHIRVSMKLVLIALGAMWIFELSRYGIV